MRLQAIINSGFMNKIKIAIIEDEFFAAAHLRGLLLSLGYEVAGVYYSGESFLKNTDWHFDAAIIDIFLSDTLTGLEIAAQLNNRMKPFIFLTANQDANTLKDAARLGPRAYISKPFQDNDVQAALEIISLGMMPSILIRTPHGTEELSTADIMFIQSDGVYIKIMTASNGCIVQRKLLKEIEPQLPPVFMRVHRSYIVNNDYIGQRTASFIRIRGHEIPVSRGPYGKGEESVNS